MAMELGADAVLVNTAMAVATNSTLMATAFAQAVTAGRNAYLAGINRSSGCFIGANASSPLTAFLS
jgi:thiazole synthase